MGDKSDAPAYLTAFGVALAAGAAWAMAVPFDGLAAPRAPVAALILAVLLFMVGAAVKAADRH
jgi:hypothetical protein